MTNEKPNIIKHSEGSPWFWKIFGGTAVSLISLLLLAYIGNITNNIDKSFLTFKGEIKDLSLIVDQQKERILSLEQNLKQKDDKIKNFEKIIEAQQLVLSDAKENITILMTNTQSLKEDIKKLSDFYKEIVNNVQNIREKIAVLQAAGVKSVNKGD